MTKKVGDQVFVSQIDAAGDVSVSPATVVGVIDPNDTNVDRSYAKDGEFLELAVLSRDAKLTALETNKGTDEAPHGWYNSEQEAWDQEHASDPEPVETGQLGSTSPVIPAGVTAPVVAPDGTTALTAPDGTETRPAGAESLANPPAAQPAFQGTGV